MNTQRNAVFPIPILEIIVSLSDRQTKICFRQTCKFLYQYINLKFSPFFIKNLCRSKNGVKPDLEYPYFGALDSEKNILYFTCNYDVRYMDLKTEKIGILCSGFQRACGIALDKKNEILYVSDINDHTISRLVLHPYPIYREIVCGKSWCKGDKDGYTSKFYKPFGLVLDPEENCLYVADNGNHAIKKIHLPKLLTYCFYVQTLSGGSRVGCGYENGDMKQASYYDPTDIVMDSAARQLYISDSSNGVIRILSLVDEKVTSLFGPTGPNIVKGLQFINTRLLQKEITTNTKLTENMFQEMNRHLDRMVFFYPSGLAFDDRSRCLYVTDFCYILRKIQLPEKEEEHTLHVIDFCARSNGNVIDRETAKVGGIVLDPHSKKLYLLDAWYHRIDAVLDNRRIIDDDEHLSKRRKV